MGALGHPILSCAEAAALERRLLGDDEAAEWSAMTRAGKGIGAAILRDFEEIGPFPETARILVLAGKGHNGGDALIAAEAILRDRSGAGATVVLLHPRRAMKPLATRALRSLIHAAPGRVETISRVPAAAARWDVCIDGVFGLQFRRPMDPAPAAILAAAGALDIRLRAAVDLPSGLGEETQAGDPVFRADFTYAAGSVKVPAINGVHAHFVGRLRYIDLGFFADAPEARLQILTPAIVAPLAALRSAEADKRAHGHLFLLGGSREYPGAILLSVLAALRSGVGLVTAFVPDSLVPAFAARAPGAIWVGWPVGAGGGLSPTGRSLLTERLGRATALAIGPGLGRDPETLGVVRAIVGDARLPLVLDADALQSDIVRAGSAPRVLTPHRGELNRILVGGDFYTSPATRDAIVVLKGRLTGITHHRASCLSPFGGPLLARGGSGDLLTGLIGGLVAEQSADGVPPVDLIYLRTCQAVAWHGIAADLAARANGARASANTDLEAWLGPALRQNWVV